MSALAPVDDGEPDANGWMTISSAPKDGSQVWLFDPNIDPAQFVGTFGWLELEKSHPDYWDGWIFADDILVSHCDDEPEPTHWRPLPNPPVSHLPSGAAACSADSPAGSTSSPIPSGTNHESDGPKSRPGDAAASLTQPSSSPRQERPSAQERSSDRSGGQFGDAPKPAHIPRADGGADITMTHEGIRT